MLQSCFNTSLSLSLSQFTHELSFHGRLIAVLGPNALCYHCVLRPSCSFHRCPLSVKEIFSCSFHHCPLSVTEILKQSHKQIHCTHTTYTTLAHLYTPADTISTPAMMERYTDRADRCRLPCL